MVLDEDKEYILTIRYPDSNIERLKIGIEAINNDPMYAYTWSLENGVNVYVPYTYAINRSHKILSAFGRLTFDVNLSDAVLSRYSKHVGYDYLSLGCIRYFQLIKWNMFVPFHLIVPRIYATRPLRLFTNALGDTNIQTNDGIVLLKMGTYVPHNEEMRILEQKMLEQRYEQPVRRYAWPYDITIVVTLFFICHQN